MLREKPGTTLLARAARHAALGEPVRLALVDELVVSDRSPTELAELLGLRSNLLAHHLEVLEVAGVITRAPSVGDGRRRYVRLVRGSLSELSLAGRAPRGEMVFLCTQNSARSQLAAALWSARPGARASSAGTAPAERVHRGAVAAARRAGLSLEGAVPKQVTVIPSAAQVVTVCDVVHEELEPAAGWWHWSIPDPVAAGGASAFDAVLDELEARIEPVAAAMRAGRGARS